MRRPFSPLLVRSVSVGPASEDSAEMRRLAASCGDWDRLLDQAEAHGVGPLLHVRLRAAGAELPVQVARKLRGVHLRHRAANEVRLRVLGEVLGVLDRGGIPALVLKGPALALLVYAEPGLRPMRDLDVLVPRCDASHAQGLLLDHGFVPASDGSQPWREPRHHLPAVTRTTDGVSVAVEIHHEVFNECRPASLDFAKASATACLFLVADRTARTLGYEQMLWHLSHHLVEIFQPFRLIGVADLVGWADRHAAVIDWDRVAREYPRVLSTLGLLGLLAPLPASLRGVLAAAPSRPPRSVGVEFAGWPFRSRHSAGGSLPGWGRIARETLLPPEWWLRLYHGAGTRPGLYWPLVARHAAWTAAHALRTAGRKALRR